MSDDRVPSNRTHPVRWLGHRGLMLVQVKDPQLLAVLIPLARTCHKHRAPFFVYGSRTYIPYRTATKWEIFTTPVPIVVRETRSVVPPNIRSVLGRAAARLPEADRQRYTEEWEADAMELTGWARWRWAIGVWLVSSTRLVSLAKSVRRSSEI